MQATPDLPHCLQLDIIGPARLTRIVGLRMRSFDMTTIIFVFQQLATELPSILTLIGSIVVAVVLWRRAPSASLYVGLACGLSLVLLILYPVAWQVVRHVAEGDPQTVRRINIAFAVFWSVVRSISTILLVVAVYVGRERVRVSPPSQPQP